MVRATSSTYFRSALPSSSGGVPTALNITSTSSRQLSSDVVNFNLFAFMLRSTISSNPFSSIGIIPFCKDSIFSLFVSTHVTSTPISAKHVPDTKPTYPVPTIAIFILIYCLLVVYSKYTASLKAVPSLSLEDNNICVSDSGQSIPNVLSLNRIEASA